LQRTMRGEVRAATTGKRVIVKAGYFVQSEGKMRCGDDTSFVLKRKNPTRGRKNKKKDAAGHR